MSSIVYTATVFHNTVWGHKEDQHYDRHQKTLVYGSEEGLLKDMEQEYGEPIGSVDYDPLEAKSYHYRGKIRVLVEKKIVKF